MGIISNLLFGDNSNNTSYKDAAYKKRFQDISNATYDSMYGGMTDYLDKNYEGGSSKFKYDFLGGLKDDADKAIQGYKESRYNTFGNGLIGGLLNPIAQTASSIGDLTGLALSGGKVNAWDSSKDPLGVSRDVGSDLGALGETALTVLPIANSLKVAKAGKAVNAARTAGKVIEPGTKLAKQAALWEKSQIPKAIGQKVAGGALFGAGYGATGSLRDMGFENFDPGQFALSTAIGSGVSGGMAGLGGLWNKYTSSVDKDAISKRLSEYAKGAGEYQDKLNILKNEGLTGNKEELSKAFDVWSKARENHPNSVSIPRLLGDGNTQVSKAEAENIYQQLVEQAMKEKTDRLNKVTNAFNYVKEKELPSLDLSSIPRKKAASFGEGLANLKNNLITTNPNGKLSKAGNKVANLLKTRKGKVIAGAGGGLLLSQLMKNNNNSNSGQLSDEEMQELYNYIYGGGQ